MSAKQNYAYALAPLMLDPPSLILASHWGCPQKCAKKCSKATGPPPSNSAKKNKSRHSTQTQHPNHTTSVFQYRHTTVKIALQSETSLKRCSSLLKDPTSIVSYLHEWRTTAMFELGTIGDALASYMSGSVWDFEAFLDCDRYSRPESCLFW